MREERKKKMKEREKMGKKERKKERKGICMGKGTCFKVRKSACVFQLCNLLFV